MGNPYYIEKRRSPLLDVANLGLKYMDMKQTGDIAKTTQGLRKSEIAQKDRELGLDKIKTEAEYGTPDKPGGLAQQRVDVAKQQVGIDRQKLLVTEQNYSPARVTRLQGQLEMKTKMSQHGFNYNKAFEPVTLRLSQLAQDDSFSNREVYSHTKSNWKDYQGALISGLDQEYQRLAKKDPSFLNSPEAAQILKSIDEISGDTDGKTVDALMPAVSQQIQNEQAELEIKRRSDPIYSPSPLNKLITEKEALLARGASPDDPYVKAYDSAISGTDIDIEELTPDEVDVWGYFFNKTGKMPSLGRGKQSTKIRTQIVKSGARQALGLSGEDTGSSKTPSAAALDIIGSQADTKSIQGAQNFLEKQLSAMGSFVDNIGMQISKVSELSKDLKTFDTRLLNYPLRVLRGKITGSPLQAKYDMYLTEIESEIGKLATGSAASIAELSTSAQEKWSKIHDKNLSVGDMLSLLEETGAAARMRRDSVQTQLEKARSKMRRETVQPEGKTVVERRQTKDGRTLVKYSDGTIGEE